MMLLLELRARVAVKTSDEIEIEDLQRIRKPILEVM